MYGFCAAAKHRDAPRVSWPPVNTNMNGERQTAPRSPPHDDGVRQGEVKLSRSVRSSQLFTAHELHRWCNSTHTAVEQMIMLNAQ